MIKTQPQPQLFDGATKKLHIVRRVGDETSKTLERYALYSEKMLEVLFEHTGNICQKCVDFQRQEQV